MNTDRTPAAANDLNLLREWREPIPPSRIVLAVAGAIVYHLIALSVVITAINAPLPTRVPEFVVDLRKAVPLYIPQDLTQHDPNRGKITHDLDVRSAAPPAPVPQAPRFRAPIPSPAAAPSIPAPIEPPKIEAEAPPPPVASPGTLPPIAPPPTEKPKLAFEAVGAGGTSPRPNYNPNVKLPPIANTVEDTLRQPTPPAPAQPSAGVTIGDIDEFTNIPSQNQAPSTGPARSNLQLLSDPAGVDFKPYLVQVLAAVRTNWLSVIPESARLGGRKGRVLIQFIIDRRGAVPKLVIAETSGTAAFDRAAVAGISASYPFPPLPNTFKGNEIRLQLAFTYNQPR